jgi:hypothetical protein
MSARHFLEDNNRCPATCPLCGERCVGIRDHLEETKESGTDLHGDSNHGWHDGNGDPSAIFFLHPTVDYDAPPENCA